MSSEASGEEIRKAVRDRYAAAAKQVQGLQRTSCCSGQEPQQTSCCSGQEPQQTSCCSEQGVDAESIRFYSKDQL